MGELLRLPGVIDTHVHLRDFAEAHKEDWESGTRAALAGGVVVVLDMPNNTPPIISPESFARKRALARAKAYCDWGLNFGATAQNAGEYGSKVITQAVCLKMFLNQTHGPLLLEEEQAILAHLRSWPMGKPIMVHAEGETVFRTLEMMRKLRSQESLSPRVHFCHISQEEEITWLREAKEEGLLATCEVTPHHLFLVEDDEKALGAFGRMKPPLRTAKDREALWQGIQSGIVDTIGSDHAPHTLEEKMSEKPPFGVPGLETTLPLLLTACLEEKLSLGQINRLTWENPRKIFGIGTFGDSQVMVDIDVEGKSGWRINNHELKTKCGWSPFDGWKIRAKVRRVYLGYRKVFEDEKILARAGSGRKVILFQR